MLPHFLSIFLDTSPDPDMGAERDDLDWLESGDNGGGFEEEGKRFGGGRDMSINGGGRVKSTKGGG